MKTAIQIFLKQTQRGTKRLALQLVLLCAAVAATLLLSLTACGEKQPEHTHKWEPANCNRGEFCFSCGETKGKALGHSWVDATCEKEKHCTLCGKSEGNALEHISDGNGVCTVCKQALEQVARLDLRNMTSNRTVYDGVIVRLNFAGTEHPRSAGFLKNFEIYDRNGTVVFKSGDFPPKVTVYFENEQGGLSPRTYLESAFIPLEQGEYLIKYRAYEHIFDDYVDKDGNRLYYVPKYPSEMTDAEKEAIRNATLYYFHGDSLIEGSAPLIVK